MLAWRLLLATGDPACADMIERTIYNGVLPGVSLDGASFFYDNPLQRRTVRAAAGPGHRARSSWFPCACCPPNLMRMLASWEQYLASTDETGIQLHQYATAELRAATAGGPVGLALETGYPWDGRVGVVVLETPEVPWSLSLRIPAWSRTSTIRDCDSDAQPVAAGTYWASGRRKWQAGDSIELELDLRPRLTAPDPRIDAVRGTVAMERGPLVYCVESADLPAGVTLEDVHLEPGYAPSTVARPDLDNTTIGLEIPAIQRWRQGAAWPYDELEALARGAAAASEGGDGTAGRRDAFDLRAIPYFAWANRSVEAMRVWIPLDSEGRPAPES
jgi:DUF1680 family protein